MKHTRFEYIGPNGREITLYGEFEQAVQDDGQTLKVFGSEAVAGWRPIETAPKDGTRVLVSSFGWSAWTAYWQKMKRVPDRWYCPGLGAVPFSPTHWMPLPPAPGAEQ